MSRFVLFRGADVNHCDVLVAHQSPELFERDRLELVASLEI
jgi:hypothetical protein